MLRFSSRSTLTICIAVGLSIAAQCGCDSTPPSDQGTPPTPRGATDDESTNSIAAEKTIPLTNVKLEIVDGDGYQAALAKHKGNVVLVDFWATWCEPCTKNFPHIVQLHHKHVAEGLRVMSFSTDELGDEAAVRDFLARNVADFDNLLTKFGNGTKTNDTFGIHGVPYYKLYDRQGELRYQFAEVFDDLEHGEPVENIDRRVAELLAEVP